MKKPALIDLDLIDALILENIKKHESLDIGTPSKVIIYGKMTALAEVSETLCSQPALVELIKAAIIYGVVFATKNCENDSFNMKQVFHNFLTQNNLTDENQKRDT